MFFLDFVFQMRGIEKSLNLITKFNSGMKFFVQNVDLESKWDIWSYDDAKIFKF